MLSDRKYFLNYGGVRNSASLRSLPRLRMLSSTVCRGTICVLVGRTGLGPATP